MTSPSLYTILSTWTLARNFVLATIGTSSKANYQSFFRLILASTVKICSSEKNLIRSDTFFKEHNSRLQRATRSWQHQICPIFNVYDLYRKSSSAIRRTVASLTPTIDANFRNDCPGLSEITLELFQQLRESLRCVLSSDSSSLAYWNFRWTVLKSYILSQRQKRLIYPKNRIISLLSAQRKGLQWSRFFD